MGQDIQGAYFEKKQYISKGIPDFKSTKDYLPKPIFEEDKNFVDCYWKAWEIAFQNIYEPTEESGFVSQYIDAAFNQRIFLWDMSFITMFSKYATPYVPGISGLDNFYAKQHLNGEICREIDRETGKDHYKWVNHENESLFSRYGIKWRGIKMPVIYKGRNKPIPNPRLTLEGMNHPILSWAEMESFQLTADTSRLRMVWEPLIHYFAALKKYLRQGNGLFVTDWAQMDNTPRNKYLMYGGTAVDISAEMALFARNLSEMAKILNKEFEERLYQKEAVEISRIINEIMWHEEDQFYYDLTLTEDYIPYKTVGGFWPLIAGVADQEKAKALVNELENENTFNRIHRVPTLSAEAPGYSPLGGYWCGSVWAPTNTMVIRGLERYGYYNLAREIANNHLKNVVTVYNKTGTIWENYAPDSVTAGQPARRDFVGWSGMAPITYFIEYTIGIKADAPNRTITWKIMSEDRVGIEDFWFADTTVDLVCEKPDRHGKRNIKVYSDKKSFQMIIDYKGNTIEKEIIPGESIEFSLAL